MTRRRVSHLALLALALFHLPARRVGAQQRAPAGYEEGAFELIAEGLPTVPLTVLVSPRGKYLVPLRALLSPLAVPYAIVPESMLVHVTRPAGVGVATLRWATTARGLVVDKLTPLDSDDVLVRGDEVYVAAPRLAELVEGAVDADLATLTIRVKRAAEFPAQIRLDVHTRRREEIRRTATDAQRPRAPVPFVPSTGVGVLEWAMGGSFAPFSYPSTVDTRFGMGLYGGMLKTRGALSQPAPGAQFQATGGELSYHRVFPDGVWLRQFQVGDVLSEGALARPMRGLTITNAPFLRSTRFGDLPFSRPLPPGWEYEVYEGDRLVGYADAASNTPLNIPLQYGTTPLHVKLYGPAGELVESAVSYVIPIEQLPAGDWQYAAGGGRCALGLCSGISYGELRHGVTSALTVQGGVDEIHDSTTRVMRPYGAVSLLPAPGWTASVQARRQAYTRASLQHFGEGRVTGGISAGINSPGGEGGISVGPDSGNVWFAQTSLQLLHVLPLLGDRSLSVTTRMEGRQRGGGGRWDVTATAPIRNGVIDVGLQSDPLAATRDSGSGTPMLRIAPTISLAHGRFERLGTPVLRVEAGFQGASLTQWDAALSLQPGRGFANISLRHLAGIPGTQLALGGSLALGFGRVLGRMGAHAGRVEGGYSANGAVAFGSVRRTTALEYGGLGLSGVEGRVFRDNDGDGQFGPGDQLVANATVQVGGLRTITDSAGRYSMWNVVPYEAIDVLVDSLSLEEPGWVPAVATRALRPSPQQYTRVDFALVRTREVIGRVATTGSMSAPSGVAVELRESRTGALYEARTFSDGAFYVSRVRPGRYLLTVVSSSLRALGAADMGPREVVVGAEGDDVVELPAVTLSRAP